MPTITLDGREMPIDGLEGCRRFQVTLAVKKEQELYFLNDGGWQGICGTYTSKYTNQDAACAAARWFERLSKTVYPFAADEYGHVIPNPKRDEYKAVARAWGALADELWEV